jgi:hypothetical protein
MRNAQSGRRRGRGNIPRPQQGGRDIGNRMEPRQRGNAMQLLEKYTNLARDAQQQGDRVQAEYFMQYADHYHRVVAEMRARHEERQAQFQQHDRRPRDHDGHERGERAETAADDTDEADDADEAPTEAVAATVDDEGDDEAAGAMRTLARGIGVADDADGEGGAETAARPRRGRGRPRRQPRQPEAERESVDA